MKINKKRFALISILILLLFLFSSRVFATSSNNENGSIEPEVINFENQNNQYNNQQEQYNNQQEQNNNQDNQQNTNQNNNNNLSNQNSMVEGDAALPSKQKTELLNMKEKSRTSLEKYIARYKNNIIYGTIAYILNMVRLAAVPVFVVGYLITIVYEFIVGMKRREMVRKGRGMRITLVSAFVMAQVLPLIFATVIKFWGN